MAGADKAYQEYKIETITRKSIRDILVKEIFLSLDKAEEEAKELNLVNYYMFSTEIGGYFELIRLLEMFCPKECWSIFRESEKRKFEVFDKAAPLIYRFRKAEIRERIHEIETSDEYYIELSSTSDTLEKQMENLEDIYNTICEEERDYNAKKS